MPTWCSVCRYELAEPGFDLGPKCLELGFHDVTDTEETRIPTAQLIFDFTGQPLFGPVETVAYL